MDQRDKIRNVAVVIPTFNEAESLHNLIDGIFANKEFKFYLVIVDDNSTDKTADLAEKIALKYSYPISIVRRNRKMGLASAYVDGFKAAIELKIDAIVQMDADLSHPPKVIPELVSALNSCDVAVGSRYGNREGVSDEWSWGRKVVSRLGDVYLKLALGKVSKDSKSGFKAYRNTVINKIPLNSIRSKGYVFQSEIDFICRKLGFTVLEIPYVFQSRFAGDSKMNFGIILEALWRPFHIRWTHRKLMY
ncbi:polyprenol monophosphomannose synthase [SAR202 cluster bacterium AD-493-K16_JPT_193m]|nr:polyprenol monophosphomannose synthase [SAR202 cluster bacterium AD-493-K16_JPT_193m]